MSAIMVCVAGGALLLGQDLGPWLRLLPPRWVPRFLIGLYIMMGAGLGVLR